MILVQTIIDEAATTFRDPAKGSVTQGDWLLYYNDAIEYMTLNWKVLEQDASHPLEANEARYLYPDDCVQMKAWAWNLTPADDTTWVRRREMFEDEFLAATNRSLPPGDGEWRYWARSQFFQITPRPTVDLPGGGLLTYWKLADRVVDPIVTPFALAGTMRLLVRGHMHLSAKKNSYRYDQYQTDLQVWERDVTRVADRLEDKSDDRAPRLRLKSAARGTRGAV